uniref:Ribosomal protein L46 N-terminal domain-containing protein n=1 Tax=Pinguiococcus pyrenoidosus TaxID=172671 RepID=A0A7R9YFF1_9STRA|mmetsp:Transcript_7147/g.27369  ORF Transcript_7147/g.27369 Transcript_7147/m.27369 type:complete len:336 (+) Transcript_7147:18-1025(+)
MPLSGPPAPHLRIRKLYIRSCFTMRSGSARSALGSFGADLRRRSPVQAGHFVRYNQRHQGGGGGWRNRWKDLVQAKARLLRRKKNPNHRIRKFQSSKLAESVVQARDVSWPAHDAAQQESGLPWRIIAAHMVMRDPQLLELPEKWEVDMKKLQLKIGRDYEDPRFPEGTFEWTDELEPENAYPFLYPFHVTPEMQLTDADKRGDTRSLQRQLTQPMYLIFKGKSGAWQFPQASHQEGEPLRATAKRAFGTVVGTSVRVHPGGAFPLGYWWYAYPEDRQAKMKAYGAKVFYLRSTYLSGDVDIRIPDRVVDYAWVTPEELGDYFSEDLYAYLKHIV